jgi:serine/threonine-protein kinase
VWAETYDRELIDLLKVQSDIAQQVAKSLRAKLTPEENARIEQKATNNPEAYALYLKGTEVLRRPAVSAARMEEGQHYFEQAIALDPNFALAHARLSQIHTRIALFFDPSQFHNERGRTEAEEALRLQPQLSEGHVSLGLYLGRLAREYDAALKEYEIARKSAPNDINVIYGIAHVQMKRGQFRAAIANWERATSLDPMNWNLFDNLGNALDAVGMTPAAERAKRRAAELASGSAIEKFGEEQSWAWTYYELTGSNEKLEESIARYQSTDDPDGVIAFSTYAVRMLERDYDRAQRVIENSPAMIFESFAGPRATKKFLLGTIALARGDAEKARPFFEAELLFARSELAESRDSVPRHLQIGLICAYLGRKEEAIAEGRRAVELLPISKDAVDGPGIAAGLAEIYGRVGELEQAITLLEQLITTPNGPTPLMLKDWNWDPIRKNPRFQKLIEGPPPNVIYH